MENARFPCVSKGVIYFSNQLLHGKQMGKQWLTLYFWAPKSLQMVIEAMK